MKRETPENLTLSDAQVREVIERAARLEPRSERVSVRELRQIAAELDIVPDALEQALEEIIRPSTLRRIRSRCCHRLTRIGWVADRLLPRRGRLAGGCAVGGLLGWASAYVMSLAPFSIGSIHVTPGAGAIVDVPVTLALVLMTLANSLSRRVHGALAKYLRETWALWLGFGAGWSGTHGSVTADMLWWLAIGLSGLTVWGCLVVRGDRGADSGVPLLGATGDPRVADNPTETESARDMPIRDVWRGRVSPNGLGWAHRFLLALGVCVSLAACETQRLTPGEGRAAVPGGEVWYRVVGDGPGAPLVVLHGGPGAPSYYLESLSRLGTDRPIVFYDQLGAGRSDQPSDTTLWRIERFMAELDSLRAHLGLGEIHLLGHSWGTMLATDYVLGGAEGIRSLVLASPALSAPLWERDADTLIATLPDSLQEAIRTHEEAGTYSAPEYQAAMQSFYARYLTIRGGPAVDSTFANFGAELYGYMWGPSEFTPTGTLRSYDRTPRLDELELPVLYTTGEFDEARPTTVAHYQSLTPGAEFSIIPGSAHLTTIDAPEAFADTVRRFLRSVESR